MEYKTVKELKILQQATTNSLNEKTGSLEYTAEFVNNNNQMEIIELRSTVTGGKNLTK